MRECLPAKKRQTLMNCVKRRDAGIDIQRVI